MTDREQRRAERVALRRRAVEAQLAAVREARAAQEAADRAARVKSAQSRRRAEERLRILAPIEEVSGLPRVLLIGDSISMGYTLRVRDLLDEANVQRIPNNGGNTAQILVELDRWLLTGGSSAWDVIHFNSGVHDAVRNVPNVSDISLTDYATNLQTLIDRFKAVSTHVVFATTTPNPAYLVRYGDHAAYNAVAVPLMQQNGVAINDLYAAILPRFAELSHGVHYVPKGYNLLASRVARSISACL